PEGFGVALDGRAVKTPAKATLALPSRALAEAIAAEWDAQQGEIDPRQMPMTRAANAAIDKVATQHAEVAALVAEYGGTDLLCYRATTPAALRMRQDSAWQPWLDWAEATFSARLIVTEGVTPVSQDVESTTRLAAAVAAMGPFELAALYDLVAISGSLVLGLAVSEGRLTADTAWNISRIDEDWQIAQWGEDEEATAHAERKRAAICDAERFLKLVRAGSET
ncbi:ATP12 family chaperone protein, partial [Phaeovulum sp.]|uniref:ATP12 family chaperone protein n=1 Tax=Phaeovulum sp. TaxID=2934796 RepID=UPI00356539F4